MIKNINFFWLVLFFLSIYAQAKAEGEPFEKKLPSSDQIKILQVNPKKIDPNNFQTSLGKIVEKECREWQLTKAQIIQFFKLSMVYANSPYSLYYQIPCDITGKLIHNGKEWDFTINGGATAYWQRNKEIKYFGCRDKQCDGLVILPTDLMRAN